MLADLDPGGVEASCPRRLKLDERGPGAVGPAGEERRLGDAEPGQLVLGEVDAPQRGVLPDVPEDVDELEGRAQGVGALQGVVAVEAEDAHAHPADHPGHQLAVAAQLLPGGVPVLVEVHLDPSHQLLQLRRGDVVALDRPNEDLHHRVAGGLAGQCPAQPPPLELEPGAGGSVDGRALGAVAAGAHVEPDPGIGGPGPVGRVVDLPREVVQRIDGDPLGAGQGDEPPVEVAGLPAGHPLAVPLGRGQGASARSADTLRDGTGHQAELGRRRDPRPAPVGPESLPPDRLDDRLASPPVEAELEAEPRRHGELLQLTAGLEQLEGALAHGLHRAGQAETVQLGSDQIGASLAPVDGDVLGEVGELQPDADVVGERHRVWVRHLEEAEHHPAHRGGGEHAVVAQLLPGGVGADPLILHVGGDQVQEWLGWDLEAADRAGEGNQHRVDRWAPLEHGLDLGPPELQPPERVAAALVTQVIGRPAVGVDPGQMEPQTARHHQRCHREVLVMAPGHPEAEGVGLAPAERCGPVPDLGAHGVPPAPSASRGGVNSAQGAPVSTVPASISRPRLSIRPASR